MSDLAPYVNDGADTSLRKVVSLLNKTLPPDITFSSQETIFDSSAFISADPNRKYLLIQNQSDFDIYASFNINQRMLLPKNGGGIVFESGFCPTGAISISTPAPQAKVYFLQGALPLTLE